MQSELFERNVPGMTEKLQAATVGIAGCGGLGSNIAVALVRAGVGRLIISDFDVIEASNLNRQHYFQKDIGRFKVEALTDHLLAINPEVKIIAHNLKLDSENTPKLYSHVDIMVEAFDKAESKQWLIETWLSVYPDICIVCGNGLSGVGDTASLKLRRLDNLVICGDGLTEMTEGLCSARVAIAANMEAHAVIGLLMGLEEL
ncbi:sulfur carrier protein ThiS adenylyltransferase ThiF [bacterium]|nr:sulfur carrier protein ThiS adenylyltransferase ThiF [bacterium]